MEIIPTTYMLRDEKDYEEIVNTYVSLGINRLRVNCTRFTDDEYYYHVSMYRKYYKMHSQEPYILLDIPSPGDKIRVRFKNISKNFEIIDNNVYDLVLDSAQTFDSNKLYINSKEFFHKTCVGDQIVIGDGDISLIVLDVSPTVIKVRAQNSGSIVFMKSIYTDKFLFKKDNIFNQIKKFSSLINLINPSGLILSFIENSEEVAIYKQAFKNIEIIPKIETPLGVQKIEDILTSCNEVLLGRGDLGMIEKNSIGKYQQAVINSCKDNNKKVIIATDILASIDMRQTIPKRAELVDVYYLKKLQVNSIVSSAPISKKSDTIKRFCEIINETEI